MTLRCTQADRQNPHFKTYLCFNNPGFVLHSINILFVAGIPAAVPGEKKRKKKHFKNKKHLTLNTCDLVDMKAMSLEVFPIRC